MVYINFQFLINFLPLTIQITGPIIAIITIRTQTNLEPLNSFVNIKYIALKEIVNDQKHITINNKIKTGLIILIFQS